MEELVPLAFFLGRRLRVLLRDFHSFKLRSIFGLPQVHLRFAHLRIYRAKPTLRLSMLLQATLGYFGPL